MTFDPVKFKKGLLHIAATQAGIDFLRGLYEKCGCNKYSVVIDPNSGELSIHSTVYNEARRSLYLDLRQLLPNDVIRKIETPEEGNDDEKNVETPDGADGAGERLGRRSRSNGA